MRLPLCLGSVLHCFITRVSHLTLRKNSRIWTTQEYVLGNRLVFIGNENRLLQLLPKDCYRLRSGIAIWRREIISQYPDLVSSTHLRGTRSIPFRSLEEMIKIKIGKAPPSSIMS